MFRNGKSRLTLVNVGIASGLNIKYFKIDVECKTKIFKGSMCENSTGEQGLLTSHANP